MITKITGTHHNITIDEIVGSMPPVFALQFNDQRNHEQHAMVNDESPFHHGVLLVIALIIEL